MLKTENVNENGARLALIRLFQIAPYAGNLKNPPSPRGRLGERILRLASFLRMARDGAKSFSLFILYNRKKTLFFTQVCDIL